MWMHCWAKLCRDPNTCSYIIANGYGGKKLAPSHRHVGRTGQCGWHRVHARMALAELITFVHFKRRSSGTVQ